MESVLQLLDSILVFIAKLCERFGVQCSNLIYVCTYGALFLVLILIQTDVMAFGYVNIMKYAYIWDIVILVHCVLLKK